MLFKMEKLDFNAQFVSAMGVKILSKLTNNLSMKINHNQRDFLKVLN